MGRFIIRALVNLFFRVGQFKNARVKALARTVRNKKILELGSGIPRKGRYPFSVKECFDPSNEFIQSDLNPAFGHRLVDVTAMAFESEFDVILCLNVLEHVVDHAKALERVFRALKAGGMAVIMVPAFYPLHDEPADYWRFTEHGLRVMLSAFENVRITHRGLRQFPFAYFVEANKPHPAA